MQIIIIIERKEKSHGKHVTTAVQEVKGKNLNQIN
jgi:hypothetical protein